MLRSQRHGLEEDPSRSLSDKQDNLIAMASNLEAMASKRLARSGGRSKSSIKRCTEWSWITSSFDEGTAFSPSLFCVLHTVFGKENDETNDETNGK